MPAADNLPLLPILITDPVLGESVVVGTEEYKVLHVKLSGVGPPPAVPPTVIACPFQGPTTDRSGTITAANTSQEVMAANAARKYLSIQNVSDKSLWFNFTVDAVLDQPSHELKPGDAFVMEGSFVSTEKITIISGFMGRAFTAKEG